jgi:ribonuclease Z
MKDDPPVVEHHLAGHQVVAVSVAGVQTCIQLPDLDLCFDIGRCPISAVHRRNVLISHGHVDHLGGLVHHVGLRAMWRMSPSRVFVPREIVGDVEALLGIWRRVARAELPCELVGVEVGATVELGRGVRATAVKASHRVPTLAWLVERTRKRLRSDLVGLPGTEIAARRQRGEDVSEEGTVLEVAFTADTRAVLLDREPRLLQARLLVCECTFVDDPRGDVDDELGHRADRFENEAILLTHFSTRYGPGWIRDALATLPEGLRQRVVPLVCTP